jgi:hypothetical protein
VTLKAAVANHRPSVPSKASKAAAQSPRGDGVGGTGVGAGGAGVSPHGRYCTLYCTLTIHCTIHCIHTLYYTLCSYCIVHGRSPLIHYTHTLYPYTIPIHYTHTLYPYTIPIHYTHALYTMAGARGGRHHCFASWKHAR